MKWIDKLEEKEKIFAFFREPDIDNELTAIACYTENGEFANLPLMS